MNNFPTTHGDKLRALSDNEKLPDDDEGRVLRALERYSEWIESLEAIDPGGSPESILQAMTDLLNSYKNYIDLELIFDSPADFLYRQKGQLKLDNTIGEEFLPRLVYKRFAGQIEALHLSLGSANCFSHLRFDEDIRTEQEGGGMAIRSKDQDFTMSRPIFIRASHDETFATYAESVSKLAFVAAEIKTNLDKTMFQEAAATASDLKLALPNARYFLICEWLDMNPISSTLTAIEEVIILRKAKRLPSNVRSEFSTVDGRRANRAKFAGYLRANPVATDSLDRFLRHIEVMLGGEEEDEEVILGRGWF